MSATTLPVDATPIGVPLGAFNHIATQFFELINAPFDSPTVDDLIYWLRPRTIQQQNGANAVDVMQWFAILTPRPSAVVGQAFKSFGALKTALGSAGEGGAWHDIVEQSKIGEFEAEAIHNTGNVVSVAQKVNSKINAYYSSKQAFTGNKTVRQWLRGRSWEEQYKFGRDILQKALNGQL